MAEKHLITKWKGSRASYNFLKDYGALDPWTLYYVIDVANNKSAITEYFGTNVVSQPSGQILAVNDLLPSLPSSGVNPYDRFLVGNDANGYKIYEYTPIKGTNELEVNEIDFDWRFGVRILSRGLKNYVYYNNRLITYDDVDCGEF